MTTPRRARLRRGRLGWPDLRSLRLGLGLTIDEASAVLRENRVLVYNQEIAARPDPLYSRSTRESYIQYAHLLLITGVQLDPKLDPELLRLGLGVTASAATGLARQWSALHPTAVLSGGTREVPSQALSSSYVDYAWRQLRRDVRAIPAREEVRQRRDAAERRAAAPLQKQLAEAEAAAAVRRFLNSA